jgi:lipopolysaccharide biosynthesis regulator YciM
MGIYLYERIEYTGVLIKPIEYFSVKNLPEGENMEITKQNLIQKFQDALEHLERSRNLIPAEEQAFLDEIIETLEEDLQKIQSVKEIAEFFDENEKTNAQMKIIDILNEMDLQLHDIESGVLQRLGTREISEMVEQFFIICQMAENVIRHSRHQGHISKEQVDDLRQEFKRDVDRMIRLSRKSDLLSQLIHQSRRAQTVIAVHALEGI